MWLTLDLYANAENLKIGKNVPKKERKRKEKMRQYDFGYIYMLKLRKVSFLVGLPTLTDYFLYVCVLKNRCNTRVWNHHY